MHGKRFSAQVVKKTPTDLILSSGLLAFSRHAGVISAIEDSRLFNIERVVGTSSGSLAGSMFAAGLSPNAIQYELSRQRPVSLLGPTIDPRSGDSSFIHYLLPVSLCDCLSI